MASKGMEDRWGVMRKILGALPVGLIVMMGCKSAEVVSNVSPEKAARLGVEGLVSHDAKKFEALLWEPEVEKTGLDQATLAKLLDGPFATLTKNFKAEGEMTVRKLDEKTTYAEQPMRTPDGQLKSFFLIGTGKPKDARVTPLSMNLFTIMGNAEQGKSEKNHYVAWRRMLSKYRSDFEAAGWRRMYSSSEFENYRNWDEMDRWLAEEAKKKEATLASR